MDDLIDEAKIDAKHSNEDQIDPFSVWVQRYGNKIGNLGGIDTEGSPKIGQGKKSDFRTNPIFLPPIRFYYYLIFSVNFRGKVQKPLLKNLKTLMKSGVRNIQKSQSHGAKTGLNYPRISNILTRSES